jgi:uncharacterized protein (DUF58 family)
MMRTRLNVHDSPKYFDPQTLAKLKGLRLQARHIVEGFVAGLHRSPHRGFSIEFAEHREYVPGDDLRYLDWKVFGRTDKFYLKQFEDETNLICYLVLDASESMAYQSTPAGLSKLDYAKCLAAALSWLVLQQQDAVGLATFDRSVRRQVSPAGNTGHLSNIVQVLEETRAEGETGAGRIFHELAERFRARGVVIILSDLFDDTESLLAGLKHFRHRRHDVVILHILDRAELEFPFDEPTRFRGLELLPDVPADPRSLRSAYLAEFRGFLDAVQRGCREWSMHYCQVTSDQPVDEALTRVLASRMKRL